MIIRETTLPGAFLIDLERHVDERGFFARTFDRTRSAVSSTRSIVLRIA